MSALDVHALLDMRNVALDALRRASHPSAEEVARYLDRLNGNCRTLDVFHVDDVGVAWRAPHACLLTRLVAGTRSKRLEVRDAKGHVLYYASAHVARLLVPLHQDAELRIRAASRVRVELRGFRLLSLP